MPHLSFMLSTVIFLASCLLGSGSVQLNGTQYLDTLSPGQRSLFTEAIGALDANFAPPLLFDSPRYSAWYAVGLLVRNEGDDVKVASDLIRKALEFQFKDPSMLWFGTFKNDINAPDPGPVFPPNIYDSYDPNNGLFVSTSWIIVIEEFQHLLDPSLITVMKESMYNATIGDGYRVGGVDGDNLFPIYSNPWYMRVMSATYVGNMMGDRNMTMWGDIWAQEAIHEFERFDTLSEFNSATYAGVTLYALSLFKYMPSGSVIAKNAPDIIPKIWETMSKFYNPSLCTLGGPWDRAYGFDMKEYFAIFGAQVTGVIRHFALGGCEPIPVPLIGSTHFADVAATLLTTLLSKFHDPLVPPSVLSRLNQKSTREPYLTRAQAVSPPFDNLSFPRNYSSWNAEGLSVGGIEFDMNSVGGASVNPDQFTPATLLWRLPESAGGRISWISHYVTSSSVSARVSPQNLTISYPLSRAFPNSSTPSNAVTFLISGIPGHPLPSDFGGGEVEELPGLKLRFLGNGIIRNAERILRYGGGMVKGLNCYNLTYVIKDDVEVQDGAGQEKTVPELVISFEKV